MELYLDCNATTPVAPEVVAAMEPFWSGRMGNPSSSHRAGRSARSALEQARQQVATLLNATPKQVIFTGSGTEANHLAILGIAATFEQPGTIAVGATEHASLHAAVDMLEQQGWSVLELPVDRQGLLGSEALKQLKAERPALVSMMVANNETGVIQELSTIRDWAQQNGARFHIDATQAAGKIALDFKALGADAVTISAHKLYGPKGVGALLVSPSLSLQPQLSGGGQERGLRSGTENVPAIVGFGKAAELARHELAARSEHLLQCRNYLELGLKQIGGVEIVAEAAPRLPNTVMCLISIIEGETLLMQLDQQGIMLSSGSACQVGKTAPNRALTAMGIAPEAARNAIRISLCRDITMEQVDHFLQILKNVLMPSTVMWRAAG